jgi:hypothetical protein
MESPPHVLVALRQHFSDDFRRAQIQGLCFDYALPSTTPLHAATTHTPRSSLNREYPERSFAADGARGVGAKRCVSRSMVEGWLPSIAPYGDLYDIMALD